MATKLYVISNQAHSDELVLAGFDCLVRARNLEEAFELATPDDAGRATFPCLVLLDTRGMGQLQFGLKRAKELPGAKLIVAIVEDLDQRTQALQAGADDTLVPPLSQDVLEARLRPHLRYLDLLHAQDETLLYATQTSFLVLISRLIGESSGLEAVLAKTLEQTVDLMNAWGGEMWLCDDDTHQLFLAASLIPTPLIPRTDRRSEHSGLVGWVFQENSSLLLPDAHQDMRFDENLDRFGDRLYHMLATPLRHAQNRLGVLALYHCNGKMFSLSDQELLEGIANLAAAAIANAQQIQRLRDFGVQQQTLFEMARQINAGLDLEESCRLALGWLGRMCETEATAIWLTQYPSSSTSYILEKSKGLSLVPGSILPEALHRYLPKDILSPVHPQLFDPVDDDVLEQVLEIRLRNLLMLPLVERGHLIGVVALVNRIGGPFSVNDMLRLIMAVGMISIAIGNASVYAQVLRLSEQREHLHIVALRNERLATIGRLTASLAHEINNPMQAIHGALSLAEEELGDPQALAEYLAISQSEVARVVRLVQRMRQMYRPDQQQAQVIEMQTLVQDVLRVARDEIGRQQVRLSPEMDPVSIWVTGSPDQIHLALLGTLLRVLEAVGEAGPADLQLRLYKQDKDVVVELAAPLEALGDLDPLDSDALFAVLNLSLAQDMLAAHGGSLQVDYCDDIACLRILLPITGDQNL